MLFETSKFSNINVKFLNMRIVYKKYFFINIWILGKNDFEYSGICYPFLYSKYLLPIYLISEYKDILLINKFILNTHFL